MLKVEVCTMHDMLSFGTQFWEFFSLDIQSEYIKEWLDEWMKRHIFSDQESKCVNIFMCFYDSKSGAIKIKISQKLQIIRGHKTPRHVGKQITKAITTADSFKRDERVVLSRAIRKRSPGAKAIVLFKTNRPQQQLPGQGGKSSSSQGKNGL